MTRKKPRRITQDDRKQVGLRIDPEFHRQLKAYVARHDTTINDLFIEKMTDWWDKHQAKKAQSKAERGRGVGEASDLPSRLRQR
jgi:NRPS condensation-like uncharacterized protein